MRRRLPIGISNFKKLIEGNYAYVDKTMLIHEIVEKGTDSIKKDVEELMQGHVLEKRSTYWP
jgi:hypothetical protein